MKHTAHAKLAMANTWDKVLEYNRDSSLYYEMLLNKFGQQLADSYWDRRYLLESERDYYYIDICREINDKCDQFLKRTQCLQSDKKKPLLN